jgi:xanthine dehydrogenase large subunit
MPDAHASHAGQTIPSPIKGGVGDAAFHDSARMHVSGTATYIDDIAEPVGTAHCATRLSERAHARITRLDTSKARTMPGVLAVLTADDIAGVNEIGAVFAGDPVLAPGVVQWLGQPIVAIAATTPQQATAAAKTVIVEYEDLPAILTLDEAIAQNAIVSPPLTMTRGDAPAAVRAAPHRLIGEFRIGGQDHFYLETHIAMAVPQDDGDMLVYSSTQHPSEVQHMVAHVLNKPLHSIVVEVRRMGGGFGGKETQPNLIACIAALLATATGRAVKYRLDRDDDMQMTGKRHDFVVFYDIGFDAEGRILGMEMDLHGRAGCSADLTNAVVDRAMFHADNCYYLPTARVTGHRNLTHTVSNTAFRGFGGPQGMLAIEYVVDEIARHLGRDPLAVRQANFYQMGTGRDVTQYGQDVEDFVADDLVAKLVVSSDYHSRREAIRAFNTDSPWLKKGLALTPVKFGISFTISHLNQAGALVHVYADGSVMLNHGGTEMGQGVYIKVAQVVAEEFGIDLDRVKVTATNTSKVPNTSATAASSGADLNGMAAQAAARTLRERMTAFAAGHFGVSADSVIFADNVVRIGDVTVLSFADMAKLAYMHRISLSSTGYYRTPKIVWDREKAHGRPFYYFAYGAAVSEVIVDTLTGEYKVLRTDILHDVGRSLNPAIDIGQIEGAFIQGMGWLTTEELWWDKSGRLRTHAPSTYKIPTCRDIPTDFRVALYKNENKEETVHRSKAVGEPPLMLGNAVFLALKDAVAATADHRLSPRLDSPATPERVLMAIEELRQRGRDKPAA